MNTFRIAIAAVLTLLGSPVAAQWQTPDHSVPVGRGSAVTGFKNAAPGPAGQPLVSNGPAADPSFQALPTIVTDPRAYGAKCDGSTDDTSALQAAINATPSGGTFYVPPSVIYTPQGLYIGGCAFSTTLIVDNQINFDGGGMYSNLKPLASFPAGQTNLLIRQNGTYRFGIKFANFSLGNDVTQVPYTRYGGRGIWAAATGGMSRMRFENLHIGESSNDYSLAIDGAGTQQDIIRDSQIAGGLWINAAADSHIVEDNRFDGRSTLGVLINMPGAGQLKYTGNVSTAVGGVIIQGMTLPNVSGNYFEELLGWPTNNAAAIGGGRNALFALISTTSAANVTANIFNMGQALSGSNPLYIGANATTTTINGNVFFNSANGNTGSVWNLSPSLICGPNTWGQTVHVVQSGAGAYQTPVGNYGGC